MRNKNTRGLRGVIWLILCMMMAGVWASESEAKIKKIKPSDKTLTIGVGESKKLKITVRPKKDKKKIEYQSYNKKILKVSKNGRIQGKKKGTTRVLIRATDGSKKKVKIKVRVVQKVKKVVLVNKKKLKNQTYLPNTTFAVKAVVRPKTVSNKKLKWKSSSDGVASVSSNGIVTTKQPGTTTITAMATDGTKKKVTCQLKVITPVSQIELEENEPVLRMKLGAKKKLQRNVFPAEASNKKISWSSTDEGVVSVSAGGTITAVGIGTADVIATAKDGKGAESRILIEVSELKDTDTKFIAHRGLSSLAPENTMAAFQLALQENFWGVECDVWQTKDGEFVISHDESLLKMCGVDKKVSELTLEEIKTYPILVEDGMEQYSGQYIPSLREYLALLSQAQEVHAVIELKMSFMTEENASALMSLLDEFSMRNRTMVISFSADCIEKVKEADTEEVVKQQLVAEIATEEIMAWCVENKVGLSCKYNGISRENIITLKEQDVEVGIWTVNNYANAYQFIKEYGVDYLTSNEKLFS